MRTEMLALGLMELHRPKYPKVYVWGNNAKRATLKGRRCRVLAAGQMRSVLVEFEGGQREIVSRRALRNRP